MTFDDLNLNSPLLTALDELGYSNPTTIQHRVFPIVMSGRDLCGIAQTGTGKTFAYLLPCLRQWKFSKDKAPQILIIVPTRELVTQVVKAVKDLTPYMSLIAVGVYGGVNINTQKAEVEKGISGATPGSAPANTIIGYLYFDTIENFQNSFGPNAEEIISDVKNFTDINPVLQISEIIL